MSAPDKDLASSAVYLYRTTTGAYDIVAGLGKASREIRVVAAGTVDFTQLDGTTTGAVPVALGDTFVLQATNITLAAGAEVFILT